MLLVWREIAVINLGKQWQFTKLTSAAIYRITHSVSSNISGTLRAVIGQSVESVVFDRRMIGYRSGIEEGHLFIKPDGINSRFLALQRLDNIAITWTVKIEELINLAESLPLPISQIVDLQDALDNKAQTQHQHVISDIAGLVELIQSIQPPTPVDFVTSQSVPSSPFQGLTWNELDADGLLVESWVYINGRWQSLTKYSFDYWGPTSSIAGNVSYNIPFDSRYDYLFKDFLVHCIYSGSGTVDETTNYWRAIVTTQPTGTTFARSGAIPNDNMSKLFPLNQVFVPVSGERLLLMYQKYGNPPGAKIGVSLRYHLLRR